MKLLVNWLIYAAAILVTSFILPGVHLSGVVAALVLAIVLGAVNMIVRPLLILLTLPITILSLGLFVLVINAVLVELCAFIVPGFSVDGFWWALFFGLVLSIIASVLHKLSK